MVQHLCRFYWQGCFLRIIKADSGQEEYWIPDGDN